MKPVAKAWAQQQQFVADASHELKTPLTAILATNNILLSNPEYTIGEQRKWIENSQAEANHMKDLINNMLFLAKSEDEKVQLMMSELSLSDIVTDTTLQFEPVAFENGTLIDSNIEGAITIQGDLTQMRQLVHILIDNACKYAGENGLVTVTLMRAPGTIRLEVNNTGTPIPNEDLPHIFERFYRSDKARTQQNQSGGYGLGLAIAKSIADRHKAQISAASSEADGTTFSVVFKNK
jgi:signal transduction histidine kinase